MLFGHFVEEERVNDFKDLEIGEFSEFGSVRRKDPYDAHTAITKLDGTRLEGADLVVKPANERDRSAVGGQPTHTTPASSKRTRRSLYKAPSAFLKAFLLIPNSL